MGAIVSNGGVGVATATWGQIRSQLLLCMKRWLSPGVGSSISNCNQRTLPNNPQPSKELILRIWNMRTGVQFPIEIGTGVEVVDL